MKPKILVTGANGYIGSRLVSRLAGDGFPVKALVRNPDWIARYQTRFPSIEIVVADILDESRLPDCLIGVDCAFYLVHSIGRSSDFMADELNCARHFAQTAARCGVQKIVYLGGLADDTDPQLSMHLRSRIEVGNMLRRFHPTVIELRASIILGTGSLSFELIRALVDRLPVMITPKWVRQAAQPIYVEDTIQYLVNAAITPFAESKIVEIGGPDQVSYGDLMMAYAAETGKKRWLLSVPVLTPRLSSLWLGLITPVYARIGRKLIEGLRNPSVVRQTEPALTLGRPAVSYREAIHRIVSESELSEGAWWFQARSSVGNLSHKIESYRIRYQMQVCRRITGDAVEVDRIIREIGGKTGYYYGGWLWVIRGWIDLIFGGAGHLRTRSRPHGLLQTGDVLDWWRVTDVVPQRKIRFESEMSLPAAASLEIAMNPIEAAHSVDVTLTAMFSTDSIFGHIYWWALYPIHRMLFPGMLAGIQHQTNVARGNKLV